MEVWYSAAQDMIFLVGRHDNDTLALMTLVELVRKDVFTSLGFL